MGKMLNKSKIFCTMVLAAALLTVLQGPVSAGELFRSKDGNFVVHEQGTSKFKRFTHSDLYMSVEFDLIIQDVTSMVEPGGVMTIHIPHFNDKAVKGIAANYIISMHDRYVITRSRISAKMVEVNKKIDDIRKTASTKDRYDRTAAEKSADDAKWIEVESLTDQMTSFYSGEANAYIDYVYGLIYKLQQTNEYRKAEENRASRKIKLQKFVEGVKGVFSIAGSVTRICYGDATSIVSLVSETLSLIKSFKDSHFKNADDVYDNYQEISEALNALETSRDESRIRSNLSRVDKAYNKYINSIRKANKQKLLQMTQDLQQHMEILRDQQGDFINTLKKGSMNPATAQALSEFKKNYKRFNDGYNDASEVYSELAKPFEEEDGLRKRKDRVVGDKERLLQNLENRRKTSGAGKEKGFLSILIGLSNVVDNIYSTVDTINKAVAK